VIVNQMSPKSSHSDLIYRVLELLPFNMLDLHLAPKADSATAPAALPAGNPGCDRLPNHEPSKPACIRRMYRRADARTGGPSASAWRMCPPRWLTALSSH